MPRLIIDAASGDSLYAVGFGAGGQSISNITVNVLVAVSYADTGDGVTKLKPENFRISNLSTGDDAIDAINIVVNEKTWDTDDTYPSGFYALRILFSYKILLTSSNTREFAFGLAVTGPFTLDKSKMLNGRTVVKFNAIQTAELKQVL